MFKHRFKSLMVGWLSIVSLILLNLTACQSNTPEQALRLQLAAMEAAATERRTDDFMAVIAEDFSGKEGMDRAALHKYLRLQMLANAQITATTGPVDIKINGHRAEVHFSVLLTGGSRAWLPEQAQRYAISSAWQQAGDTWRLYYADWQPL